MGPEYSPYIIPICTAVVGLLGWASVARRLSAANDPTRDQMNTGTNDPISPIGYHPLSNRWSPASLQQYLLCALKGIVQIRPKQIAVCGNEFSGGPAAHEGLNST